MTSTEYYKAIKEKYPNTLIGLNAFYINNLCGNSLEKKSTGFSAMISVPLDYMISIIIKYIEYREVNFLTALNNTSIDNVSDNHETLRLKTVTHILNRLEKYINPPEGQPF